MKEKIKKIIFILDGLETIIENEQVLKVIKDQKDHLSNELKSVSGNWGEDEGGKNIVLDYALKDASQLFKDLQLQLKATDCKEEILSDIQTGLDILDGKALPFHQENKHQLITYFEKIIEEIDRLNKILCYQDKAVEFNDDMFKLNRECISVINVIKEAAKDSSSEKSDKETEDYINNTSKQAEEFFLNVKEYAEGKLKNYENHKEESFFWRKVLVCATAGLALLFMNNPWKQENERKEKVEKEKEELRDIKNTSESSISSLKCMNFWMDKDKDDHSEPLIGNSGKEENNPNAVK